MNNHAILIVCSSEFVVNKFRDELNFHLALSGYNKADVSVFIEMCSQKGYGN